MYTSLAVVVGEYGAHGIPSTLTYQETKHLRRQYLDINNHHTAYKSIIGWVNYRPIFLRIYVFSPYLSLPISKINKEWVLGVEPDGKAESGTQRPDCRISKFLFPRKVPRIHQDPGRSFETAIQLQVQDVELADSRASPNLG